MVPQVGDARLQQDDIIVDKFITPWQATLSSSLALANKARANVKAARLELDTARAAYVIDLEKTFGSTHG
jgi:hypothetical protein